MATTMVCILCAIVILKPQEFTPILSGVPIVHILFVLCVATGVLDVLQGKTRLSLAPHVALTGGFFAWAAVVTFVRSPQTFFTEMSALIIELGLFAVVAFFPASVLGVQRVCGAYLLATLFAASVAVMQASGPLGCMQAAADDWEGREGVEFDGRACETSIDCRKDPPVLNANYRCEHLGPLGTSTIGGRVRYRGTLADPNDLSLATALALPFLIAFSERQTPASKSKRRNDSFDFLQLSKTLATIAAIAVVGTMIVLSQSRMGVLVFIIVLGLAFLRRAGMWGVILGLIFLPPVLFLGGRAGGDADASSKERLDLLAEALSMIRQSHGIGVGMGRFADESSTGLTAHNSYLLVAAELGLVGVALFCLILYSAIKVPVSLWLGHDELDPELKRWSSALAIGFVGAYVGIFFLSWAYKEILYIMFGLSAALHQVARQTHPHVRIALSAREVTLVVGFALTFVPLMYALVRIVG